MEKTEFASEPKSRAVKWLPNSNKLGAIKRANKGLV